MADVLAADQECGRPAPLTVSRSHGMAPPGRGLAQMT